MTLKLTVPRGQSAMFWTLCSLCILIAATLFLVTVSSNDLNCLFPSPFPNAGSWSSSSSYSRRYLRQPHDTAPNVPILRKPRCIVYDRPPRTGSTTVASVLAQCFRKHRFYVPKFPSRRIRHLHVPLVLSRLDHDFAFVAHHFWLSDTDITLLESRCRQTFFMTSAAPIHERIWSAAKVMSTTSRNGNFSVGETERRAALQWLAEHGPSYAPYLEAYPFIDLLGPQLVGPTDHGAVTELPNSWAPGLIPRDFQYDFVVRKPSLQDDLAQILDALNCSSAYTVKNVHVDSDDLQDTQRDALLFNISQDSDGVLYTALMTHAARANHLGLLKLKRIISDS